MKRCWYSSSLVVLLLFYVELFVLQAPSSYCVAQACSSDDIMALKGFVNSLESGSVPPGWVFSASNSSTNCCQWVGVSCGYSSSSSLNSSVRVLGLNLSSMGLKGSVSTSVSDLNQLSVLDLSNNSLSNFIPPNIFNLQHLRILDLSLNNFSGAIPVETFLPSIQYLNVSWNELTGNSPVLAASTTLSEYDASHNKFHGPVNTTICTVSPWIKTLDLSSNYLSGGFPMGFGNCSSLQKLRLDNNHITGNFPGDLFKLPSLKELYVEDNLLGGTISSGICNLSNLVMLDISENNFSGRIPESFGSLRMLRSFSASSNRFTGTLPASFSNLSAIQVLNLRNNSFDGEINFSFENMANLSALDLGSNQFRSKIPPDLPFCLELKTVNLARNMFEGEIPEGFKNLHKLSYLSLSNNSLSNISSALRTLQHCPNITILVLTMNFYGEGMTSDGIQGFQNLKLIAIANSGLSGVIPLWLRQCSNLQIVDLSWNRLGGNIYPWFGDFQYIFYLDLSNNSLTGEIPSSITKMKSLAFSSYSHLTYYPTDFPFFRKKNNDAKRLQYNQLNSFPPSLLLSHNMLVGPIWPQFGNLERLHVLDLGNNHLSGSIPDQLSNMSSLEILDLSHNELTGNIPSSMRRLNFLSFFSVAYNHLVGSIPNGGQFSTFPNASFEGNLGLYSDNLSPCKQNITCLPDSYDGGSILTLQFKIGAIVGFLPAFIVGTLYGYFGSMVRRCQCLIFRDYTTNRYMKT